MSYDNGYQSAQNSPNQNRYDALQDDQGEVGEDDTLNAPNSPEDEVSAQEDSRDKETEENDEESNEPQGDLEESNRHNSDDDAKDSDFRAASSE